VADGWENNAFPPLPSLLRKEEVVTESPPEPFSTTPPFPFSPFFFFSPIKEKIGAAVSLFFSFPFPGNPGRIMLKGGHQWPLSPFFPLACGERGEWAPGPSSGPGPEWAENKSGDGPFFLRGELNPHQQIRNTGGRLFSLSPSTKERGRSYTSFSRCPPFFDLKENPLSPPPFRGERAGVFLLALKQIIYPRTAQFPLSPSLVKGGELKGKGECAPFFFDLAIPIGNGE